MISSKAFSLKQKLSINQTFENVSYFNRKLKKSFFFQKLGQSMQTI